MVLVLTINWLGCCVGSRIRLDFSLGDRDWLDFSAGIRIDLVLCGGRKSLGLESGSKLIWFSCRGASKLILLCGRPKLTWFQRMNWNWLGFFVVVENDLFLVSGSKLTRLLCRGIETGLILEWGSKLTPNQWCDLEYLGFCVRDRNWLGFSVWIEIDLFLCGGQNWLRFCVC